MSLDVVQLPLGPIQTNCYLVRRPGAEEAVVVDPSGDAAEIRLELARLGARCVAILVTHGHWDHLGGVADLAEGTGAPVHMSDADRERLERPAEFTPPGVYVRAHTPEAIVADGDRLELAGISFHTYAVPGHSPGHLAFAADGELFSGDVLFAGSVGRTDIPGSDWETLAASIRRLIEALPPDTVVRPGHGPATTLGHELSTNPFLADLRASRR
jgi:glyoxylase-like metal-dependent hydrolase (beta-lactamase superfamily II)